MQPTIYQRTYSLAGTELTLGKSTRIMGILNATPDSFSDGGRYNDIELAVSHAKQMVQDGAAMIDIGGESTRPGHEIVGLEEELARVIPIITAVSQAIPQIPISIDTYKSEVARQALLAGAHMINDVWGFKRDPDMAAVAAEFGCPVILMHNRHDPNYSDLISDIISDLQGSIDLALSAGVRQDHIILDPGIGFAKNDQENLMTMRSLDKLAELGYPLLLGTSRKRFIRNTLDVSVDNAILGTAATVALGIAQGCQIVRVHDIVEIKQTVLMCDAILYNDLNGG